MTPLMRIRIFCQQHIKHENQYYTFIQIEMKLSKGAEEMADLLLKHYPINFQGKQKTPHSHSQHQKPQQHLHDYRKEREIFDKPTIEKLENMEFFKEEGNNHYKNQRYSEAMYFYQKVIIYGDYTFPDNEAETNRMDAVLQQSNCNLALSMIKLDKWKEAKVNLLEAKKGKNISIKAKANYWLSKYYLRQGQAQLVQQSIAQIKSLSKQHHKYVQELELELQELLKKQANQGKQVFKNMFKP